MSLLVIAGLAAKSGLMSLGGLACARLIGGGAVDRANVLRATVCLLLALPVVSAALPTLTVLLPTTAQAAPSVPLWEGEVGRIGSVAVSGAVPWPSLGAVALAIWLLGMTGIVARLALGLRTLDAWTRSARPVLSMEWLTVVDREAAHRRPRLLRSGQVAGPLSWGLNPGVILVDPASLERPGAAAPILAHELAHLRRRDWLFLILSRLAVAVFWFNPLVWRLHAELVA
ncbi:MAG: M56 family metallopeptidase, partial [Brevundimonas sp.]